MIRVDGGLEDFQTSVLPAPFTDLRNVSFTGIGPLGPGHSVLDNLVFVPEPVSAALLAFGLALSSACRRVGRRAAWRSNFRYFNRYGVSASSPRRRLRFFS